MQVRFSRSARKHRIGRAAALEALADARVSTQLSADKLLWIGTDHRNRELEIIGIIAAEDPELVIIIHVMPTTFRKEGHGK